MPGVMGGMCNSAGPRKMGLFGSASLGQGLQEEMWARAAELCVSTQHHNNLLLCTHGIFGRAALLVFTVQTFMTLSGSGWGAGASLKLARLGKCMGWWSWCGGGNGNGAASFPAP